MKKLLAVILLCIVMMNMTASLAEPGLPPHASHRLSGEELDAFFASDGYDLGLHVSVVNEVYKLIENRHEAVFGMNFSALETGEQAKQSPYAEWNVDFTITTNKDVYVLLAGNYGDWGTVVIPVPVQLKAGEPFRVMEKAGMYLPYKEIATMVKNFSCVAVPITEEAKEAWVAAGGNPEDLSEIPSADSNTHLGLSLDIHKTERDAQGNRIETGLTVTLGNPVTFAYKPEPLPEILPEPKPLPKTGDASNLVLWAAMFLVGALALGSMRRRYE